jgi:hypothetical protein
MRGYAAHNPQAPGDRADPVPWYRVTALHLALAATLLVVVWQSAEHLAPGEAGLGPRTTAGVADGILGPWLNWDAGVFQDIARHGYRSDDRLIYDAGGESRIAYFPGYPLVARAAGALVGDVPLGMIAVTFASGLGAAVVFNRWLRAHTEAGPRTCALLALLLFPWAFFLVATGYSDALFLLTSLGAFVLMEEDRPVAALASGFVATLTRPVGGAVTVGLLLIAVQRRRARRAEEGRDGSARSWVGAPELAAVASIGGLLCFMAFCWTSYGHPLAFSVAQRGWNQAAGPHTWFKITLLDLVQQHPDPWFVWRLVLQGIVALVFAAAIPAVWRRFGPAYGAYTAIVVLVPLVGSAAFASQGRYMLAAFPVFALLGEHLYRWTAGRRLGYLLVSAAGLLLNASFWARGYWMG